jgi:photosystem II stability/assembly factor-like uncharacterized protein
MAPKINRILIPLVLLLFTLSIGSIPSAAQDTRYTSYIPLITYSPTGWIGPYGGTVVSVIFDPIYPTIMYAGSYGSGVYKSLNSGRKWISASQGLTNLFIYSLAIDPQNPSTIYAGTYRGQIFKSTNGGSTWNWSGSGIQSQAIVYCISIDPVSPNIIYASTRGVSNNGSPPWSGVMYKSTNGGSTWAPILQNLGGAGLQDWVYSILVNPHAHNQVLIAAHETGPYRSDNYGVTWNAIDNGIQDYSGRAIAVGLQAEIASTYYYGVWHQDTIYKSTNSGSSWIPVNEGIPYQHVYSIALDPSAANNVFLGTFRSGVLKSVNGGTTWQSGGLSSNDIYSVVLRPGTPNYMLASTDGDGLYRTGNYGLTWYHSNTGIENSMATSVVLSAVSTDILYASTYGAGVYISEDQGVHWSEYNVGLTDKSVLEIVKDPAHPYVLYALTGDGGLFKNAVNTGNGWTSTGQGLPLTSKTQPAFPADHPFATLDMQEAFANEPLTNSDNTSAYVDLLDMVFAPSNAQIAYIGTSGSGVYRSSDGGQTWQSAGLSSYTVYSLAVDPTNPNLVYAATDLYGSLLVTTNGGKSWGNAGLNVAFYSLIASPTDSGVVYAGTNNGVYVYHSGVFSSLGLTGQKITAVELNPTNSNDIYAGTDQKSYYSLNAGHTWTTVDNSLDGKTIYSISIDPVAPNLVYFCTTTHGIYLMASQ